MDEFNLEEKLPDGKPRYQVLANGAVYDHTIKKIVTNNLTSEQGRALVLHRYDQARQKTIEALDEAAIEKGLIDQHQAGSGDGWKAIIKHVAKTLHESSNLRGQAEAARFLGQASGYVVPDKESGDLADRLASILERYLGRDIIEGKVKDGNS